MDVVLKDRRFTDRLSYEKSAMLRDDDALDLGEESASKNVQ